MFFKGVKKTQNSYCSEYYILANANILDDRGIRRQVSLSINPKGTYEGGDLYVFGDFSTHPVYEDSTFITNMFKVLRRYGYKDRKFPRAEMGMQRDDYNIFEGTEEFRQFVRTWEANKVKALPLEDLPLYLHTLKTKQAKAVLLRRLKAA